MSEPQPGESRPEFRPSRRGYDRGEVERFVNDALERIAALHREREALDQQLVTLGVNGAADLQEEIETAGAEVRRVLHAAREAADSLRSRAADDVARWRAEAEADAADLRASAQQDAEDLRASAWDTGVELLSQSQAEAEAMRAAAKHDTLVIRAEAEQEAHRLVAGARRDIQEEARVSRLSSERTLAEAKAEAERLVESARLEAEAAQERAGALEQRRAELMQELEEARAAIAGLESDLETRREALRLSGDDATDQPPSAGPGDGGDGEWLGGDTSVRIVQVRPPRPSEAVDADAMAAEVERLRVASPSEPEEPEEPEKPEGEAALPVFGPEAQQEPPVGGAPGPEAAGDEPPPVQEPEPLSPEPAPPEPAPPEPTPLPESPAAEAEATPAAADPDPVTPPVLTVVADAAPPAEEAGDVAPPLDDLFSRLRGRPAETAANGGSPAPEASAAAPITPDPAPEALAEPNGAKAPPGGDPFELRDRLLMPLTNHALRAVKRAILDLQNEALDELRTSGEGWVPDAAAYEARFEPDLASLAAASRQAGAAAAARLAEADTAPEIGEGGPVVAPFGAVLAEAVRAALDDGGAAGSRAPSAPTSRVYRGWRSDEAERRVRSAAYLAYHAALVDGLASLGVGRVHVDAPGIPCAECPASHDESWDPAGAVPSPSVLPPSQPSCVCTVVPAL